MRLTPRKLYNGLIDTYIVNVELGFKLGAVYT